MNSGTWDTASFPSVPTFGPRGEGKEIHSARKRLHYRGQFLLSRISLLCYILFDLIFPEYGIKEKSQSYSCCEWMMELLSGSADQLS